MADVSNPRIIICAIALEENAYVDEWVSYYRGIGVDGIYIYDNSADATLAHLPEMYEGFVTTIHFPGRAKQLGAYLDCVARHKGEDVWCAFIDLDEFIVLHKHDSLGAFVREHAHGHGSIFLNWVMFGTAGHIEASESPVLERFQYREPSTHINVKCIAYLPRVATIISPHFVVLADGTGAVGTCGTVIHGPQKHGGREDVAAVYHLYSRSVREQLRKVVRGRATIAKYTPRSFLPTRICVCDPRALHAAGKNRAPPCDGDLACAERRARGRPRVPASFADVNIVATTVGCGGYVILPGDTTPRDTPAAVIVLEPAMQDVDNVISTLRAQHDRLAPGGVLLWKVLGAPVAYTSPTMGHGTPDIPGVVDLLCADNHVHGQEDASHILARVSNAAHLGCVPFLTNVTVHTVEPPTTGLPSFYVCFTRPETVYTAWHSSDCATHRWYCDRQTVISSPVAEP